VLWREVGSSNLMEDQGLSRAQGFGSHCAQRACWKRWMVQH
jgi:hypothetical protein